MLLLFTPSFLSFLLLLRYPFFLLSSLASFFTSISSFFTSLSSFFCLSLRLSPRQSLRLSLPSSVCLLVCLWSCLSISSLSVCLYPLLSPRLPLISHTTHHHHPCQTHLTVVSERVSAAPSSPPTSTTERWNSMSLPSVKSPRGRPLALRCRGRRRRRTARCGRRRQKLLACPTIWQGERSDSLLRVYGRVVPL